MVTAHLTRDGIVFDSGDFSDRAAARQWAAGRGGRYYLDIHDNGWIYRSKVTCDRIKEWVVERDEVAAFFAYLDAQEQR